MAALRDQGAITKRKTLKTGRTIGGIPFNRGPLAYLLRNRFYIGEVVYKDEILKGEQEPILDRPLFDRVQEKLSDQRVAKAGLRSSTHALLMGLIVDDRGNAMTPTHTVKKGVRYRYYISTPLLHGQASVVGSVRRVPAVEVEGLVLKALRRTYRARPKTTIAIWSGRISGACRSTSDRVVVTPQREVRRVHRLSKQRATKARAETRVIEIPWDQTAVKRKSGRLFCLHRLSRDDVKRNPRRGSHENPRWHRQRATLAR